MNPKLKSKDTKKSVYLIVRNKAGKVVVHDPDLRISADDMGLGTVRYFAKHGKRMGFDVVLKGFKDIEVESILKKVREN